MRPARIPSIVLLVLLSVGLLAPAATAKRGKPKVAPTKMTFTLDAAEVTEGDEVTGTVRVRTRTGRTWAALPDASVAVFVDGVQVDEVVTDSTGTAAVSYPADEVGEHVMKVVYAGDATHRKAKRARGFEVLAAPIEETTTV